MSRLGLAVALAASSALARPDNLFYFPTSNTQVSVCAYVDNAGKDFRCGGNRYAGHRGTDIGLSLGSTVLAAAAGKVIMRTDGCPYGGIGSTCGGGFGNHVVVFHATGDTSIYGHLTAGSNIVANGSQVGCGDRLGASGSSGNSSGPHLHFETRIGASAGSPYSGSTDDPFAGTCSGPITYWANQGTGYVSSCGAGPSGGAHPQSATTCGCPAGTYPLWNCNDAKTARVRCSGGQVQTEACANGCEVKPYGTDDVCSPPPPCPAGLGAAWTCSGANERSRCVDGQVTKEACALGCEAPSGAEATCKAKPSCPQGVGAAWTCSGDGQRRERCVDGQVDTEPCATGCSAGTPDATCNAAACPAGLSAAWSCTTQGLERARCEAGQVTRETCAHGCEDTADGAACKSEGTVDPQTPPGCPAGTFARWTCELDGTTLARCVAGTVQTTHCAGQCVRSAAGEDDRCPDLGTLAPALESQKATGGCSTAGGLVSPLLLLAALRRKRA
ncbi:MAG: M23 family metallopeptidase [Myxococcaceae bacterium]|nr:M23 family metallopeptidase [Myxococcaceae bacterium]